MWGVGSNPLAWRYTILAVRNKKLAFLVDWLNTLLQSIVPSECQRSIFRQRIPSQDPCNSIQTTYAAVMGGFKAISLQILQPPIPAWGINGVVKSPILIRFLLEFSHKYRVPPKLTRTIGFSNLFWIPQVPHSHSDWHGISSSRTQHASIHNCQILKTKMPNNMSFTQVTPPNNLAINQAIVWGCLEI